MTDLFADKAAEWDARSIPQQISEGVFSAMQAAVDFSPEQVVMDFGAGTGLIATQVAPIVKQLLAVDISPAMLSRLAQKPALQGRSTVYCQDILADPLTEKVDIIVSAMAAHHVEDTQALLQTLHDHLRPGGTLALADLDAEDGSFHPPGIDGVYHHGFDRDALLQHARHAGFTDINFTTACTVSHAQGRYPVFLLTARRG